MHYASQGCWILTGYSPDELVLNKLTSYGKLIHPDDQELVWDQIQEAVASRTPFELIYRIYNRNEEVKWVHEWGNGIFDEQGSLVSLEGFISDITAQKKAEIEIEYQSQRLQALRKIDMAITASFDIHLTLNLLLDQIITHLKVDAADILLFIPSSQSLNYAAGKGFRTTTLQYTHLQIGESFAGKAALTRKTIHIPDLSNSLGQLKQSSQFESENFACYFGVPLIAKGQIKGVLEAFFRSHRKVDSNWMEFLEALAGQAAIALDNATLFSDLQRSNTELTLAYDATLERWAKALELCNREMAGHTDRVIYLTTQLAQKVYVEPDELPSIRRGSMLHDIGKMGIPDSILLKSGSLTDEEWEVIHRHPVFGYELLSPISYLRDITDIPYCHHEKWSGDGYPRGLKAEEIPLSARIFAVADVWDSLTTDHPYRLAWSAREARSYIASQSGKHFDPQVVTAFMELTAI